MSGRYMPYMESVFRKYGLPIELTRLPYVESSFNLHAYSSVAAAGIWQFMPASGRIY
ncbi:MAG: transglycosylase SLT domain-containing protein, partial [Nevskiales bacterium]